MTFEGFYVPDRCRSLRVLDLWLCWRLPKQLCDAGKNPAFLRFVVHRLPKAMIKMHRREASLTTDRGRQCQHLGTLSISPGATPAHNRKAQFSHQMDQLV